MNDLNPKTAHINWSDSARYTYDRMPPDVQSGVDKALMDMVERYGPVYHKRPPDMVSVGTVSHVQVPDWGMWLRFETEYAEDEHGPWLYIEIMDELTKAECESSVAAARINPNRVN